MEIEEKKQKKGTAKKVYSITLFVLSILSNIDFIYAFFFNDFKLLVPYYVHTVIILLFFVQVMIRFQKCTEDKFRSLTEFLPLFIFLFCNHLAFLFSKVIFWIGVIIAIPSVLLIICFDLSANKRR